MPLRELLWMQRAKHRIGDAAALVTGWSGVNAPSILTVTASSGMPGDIVILAGGNFTNASAVHFGAASASFTVLNDATIRCTVPSGAGTVDVSVTAPGGTGTKAQAFLYTGVAPTISSLNFSQGDPVGGGSNIVITGTALDTVTSVTFGGTAATILAQSSTQCTVSLPAHASGVVTVVATNPSGSASTSFEYWSPKQVTGIDALFDAEIGITLNGGTVSAWADQSGNARDLAQATGAAQPTYTASAFSPLHGLTFAGSQRLDRADVAQSTGRSVFAVAKWTSTNNAPVDYAGNAPLVLVGDGSGNVQGSFGASAGAVEYSDANNTGLDVTRGSGLNDGAARLIGATHDSATSTVKLYVGATQQGASGVISAYDPRWGWTSVGAGYSLATTGDGFDGTIGAVVIVDGVISGADLTKLNAWAQQRWGTP